MICCFRSSSRHAMHAGVSEPKKNLLIPFNDVFDSFFKFFLCFHTVSTWYFQFFCKLKQGRLVHLILVFVTQGWLQKSFNLPFTPRIIHHHHHHHHHHSTCYILFFCISVFALFNIYQRMIIFTLFVDRINL